MIEIRLKPTGRVKRSSFRIVVDEKRSKLNGRSIDDLGFYNPSVNPSTMKLDTEKFKKWVSQGAQISKGVAQLLKEKKA